MNIDTLKAITILGLVEDATTVYRDLLLADDGFCKLMTETARDDDIDAGVAKIIQYVTENY